MTDVGVLDDLPAMQEMLLFVDVWMKSTSGREGIDWASPRPNGGKQARLVLFSLQTKKRRGNPYWYRFDEYLGCLLCETPTDQGHDVFKKKKESFGRRRRWRSFDTTAYERHGER